MIVARRTVSGKRVKAFEGRLGIPYAQFSRRENGLCAGDWPSWRPAGYDEGVKLTIDLDREEDGRWIAEALELPGVLCYGHTREEAISNTERRLK
jgi:hypothetical protein